MSLFLKRYVEKYEGSTAKECQPGGRFFNQKAHIKESLRSADKAIKMSPDERKDLVLCIPSDEESEDEDDMDVVDGIANASFQIYFLIWEEEGSFSKVL